MTASAYQRVLIKLSGEILKGSDSIHDPYTVKKICQCIKSLQMQHIEVGIVIGAGNIFRGIRAQDYSINKVTADKMGMMGTIINAILLKEMLSSLGCYSHVLSAVPCGEIVESFSHDRATRYMAEGKIVIFAGGTGHPFFTTDTAAALRASETNCNLLMKATKVDGVYDKDPHKFSDAKRYSTLTYSQVLSQHLKFMDATAVSICRSQQLPILVFHMEPDTDIYEILTNPSMGTLISD